MKLLCLLSASVLLSTILASSQNASAITAGELKNLKVIGHHFTTTLNDGEDIIWVKKPSEARYVIIKFSVEVPPDDSKIFLNDFVLHFFQQNGKEMRRSCKAICRAKTAELSEDDGCVIGSIAWVVLNETSKYFSLVFFVQSNVNSINIGRIGAAPLNYQLGSDRPFSVFITTNQGSGALSKIEKVIRAGGYQVTRTSTSLADEKNGITIHYADKAEIQAREISQRIMTEMGIAPVVKKMKLISDNDIVVWLGK